MAIRKIMKRVLVTSISAALALATSGSVYAGTQTLSGGMGFFVNSISEMHSGWFLDSIGDWYYFGPDGAMYSNTTTPDGSRVDASGAKIAQSDSQDDYSIYVGKYLNKEETARYWDSGFVINRIAGGKIYGYYRQDAGAYSGFTADFTKGVEIENGSFVLEARYQDVHSEYDPIKHRFNEYVRYCAISCELGFEDGKPSIVTRDDPDCEYTYIKE